MGMRVRSRARCRFRRLLQYLLLKTLQSKLSHSKGSAIQTYRSVDPKEAQLIPDFFYEIGG
jgi:hypothetical protein